MTELLKTNFILNIRDEIAQSNTDSYYITVGNHTPWNVDDIPPTESETFSIESISNNLYDQMICGKRVDNVSDIMACTKRYDWEQGQVYDMYTPYDTSLSNKRFYVVTLNGSNYEVFKCLYNNNNAPSTMQPKLSLTSEDDAFFETNDGYKWKYLYSVSISEMSKFGSANIMPVVYNSNVASAAVPGSIPVVNIVSAGINYNSSANGYFREVAVNGDELVYTIDPTSSANTNFYKDSCITITEGLGQGQQRVVSEYNVSGGFKRIILSQKFDILPDINSKYEITPNVVIEGDGEGAVARAIANTINGKIEQIEINNFGVGYTWCNMTVRGNTGIITSNGSVNANTAILQPIISPSYGHGGNVYQELYTNSLTLSTTLSNTEFGTIPATGTYRTYSVIKNPEFNNVVVQLSSSTGSFVVGENVKNTTSNVVVGKVDGFNSATQKLTLHKAHPLFGVGDIIKGTSSNTEAVVVNTTISNVVKGFDTFDQRLRLNISMNNGTSFTINDTITQQTTNATGIVHYANSTFVGLTNVRGTFLADDVEEKYPIYSSNFNSANVNSILQQDLNKSSGTCMYLKYTAPITRNEDTSDKIKITIGI